MFQVKETVMFHGKALDAIVVGRALRSLEAAERMLSKRERAFIVDKNTGRIVKYGAAGPAACLGIA